MESPHLFTHVYDIDTIIAALCSQAPQWLETATGTLHPEEPAGVPPAHRFRIEPLPATFLKDLPQNPAIGQLSSLHRMQLEEMLATAAIASLPSLFPAARTGAWVRERVKEAALEWLDMHNLIPPSMRHINRKSAQTLATSVNITPPEEE
jgi:hypothetical protein